MVFKRWNRALSFELPYRNKLKNWFLTPLAASEFVELFRRQIWWKFKAPSCQIPKFLVCFGIISTFLPIVAQDLTTSSESNAYYSITLDEALRRVWFNSPSLMIATDEIGIKQSEEYQAGRLPNPVAAIQIEGANSVGSRKHCSDREIFYTLSQLIELGGKRGFRKQEAAYMSSLAMWDMEMTRLDLLNEVTKAFVDVAALQETIRFAEDQERIAHEILSTVQAKIEGGKEVHLKARKAEMAKAKATLALEKAKRDLELSKKKLAALWGSSCADFFEVQFPLYELNCLPNLSLLVDEQAIHLNKLWNMQISAAEKAVDLEKAQRIPDVVVTAGYVQSEDSGGSGLLIGLQMPIPIFDRNSGNINRAKILLGQAYEKQEESLLQSKVELQEAYADLFTAYKEGLIFKDNILLAAEETYHASHEGYQKGKYDYLELLDSQRTLFEEQEAYISKLVEYHYKKTDVNRLVGRPLKMCE